MAATFHISHSIASSLRYSIRNCLALCPGSLTLWKQMHTHVVPASYRHGCYEWAIYIGHRTLANQLIAGILGLI